MKRGFSSILAGGTGILLATLGQPGFAQGVSAQPGQAVPSQADIVRALRPVPSALREGTQGLPTIGGAVRQEPNASLTRASTSGGLVSPAGRTGQAAHASTAMAAPPGCPAHIATRGQPMVAFKVEFEFGSAQLKPEAVLVLQNLGKALNEGLSDQKQFEIEGHTDAVGSLSYNDRLSTLRAQAVKDFLVQQMGVSPQRLSSVGKAFCEPVDPANPKGAANRRVVVINQTS